MLGVGFSPPSNAFVELVAPSSFPVEALAKEATLMLLTVWHWSCELHVLAMQV